MLLLRSPVTLFWKVTELKFLFNFPDKICIYCLFLWFEDELCPKGGNSVASTGYSLYIQHCVGCHFNPSVYFVIRFCSTVFRLFHPVNGVSGR